jgi:hypothetical protein
MLNTSPSSDSISHHALGMLVKPSLVVANTGATLLFLTKGAPSQNKHCAKNPVSITLPDGRKIKSMQMCDVMIPGLPTVLTGHIMPDMTTASLFGIRVLCKAGCQVLFDNNKCQVIFNSTVILTGYKDMPATSGCSQSTQPAYRRLPLMLRINHHSTPA